jgi:hypothetical protein
LSAAIGLDFVSRDCKSGIHHDCCGKWMGLGFEIICVCKCDHNRKGEASTSGGLPISDAKHLNQFSSKEISKDDH